MNITIKTIPNESQEYLTIGDWRFDEAGNLNIFISDMGNWEYEALVAVHELCEVILCKKRGITTDAVDNFDKSFEALREMFPAIIGDVEPGEMKTAPYFSEHRFATIVEKALANELNVNWDEYTKTVDSI